MKKSNLLPAVMLSLSAMQSVAPMAASASPLASSGGSGTGAAGIPVVLKFQAEHKRVEPERLRAYERALAERTGFNLAMMPEGRCGTISGSGDGWDDSRADC